MLDSFSELVIFIFVQRAAELHLARPRGGLKESPALEPTLKRLKGRYGVLKSLDFDDSVFSLYRASVRANECVPAAHLQGSPG